MWTWPGNKRKFSPVVLLSIHLETTSSNSAKELWSWKPLCIPGHSLLSKLCWGQQCELFLLPQASLLAQIVKNLAAMKETRDQSLGQKDSLEKGMAIHSSILALKIPWTEEPGYSPQGNKKSDHKEGWVLRNWWFQTMVLEKTLESPLDSKEVNSEYSLEELKLKLKLQYMGCMMQRADSLEKTLMLGKTESRRWGQQRMRWLDGIIETMDTDLSKFWETVKDREVCVMQFMGLQRVGHGWATERYYPKSPKAQQV